MSNRYLLAFLLLVLIFIGTLSYFEPTNTTEFSGPVETITLGIAKESLASLAYIAEKEGFFTTQGVNVRFKYYKGGKQALHGLFNDEVELATTADVPIVFYSFSRSDFNVLATIGSSNNEPGIVARKSSGIVSPADLIGKRIMTKKGSAVHYYLDVFLTHNLINVSDIKLTFTNNGENIVNSLVNQEIDAFSHRQPYVGRAKAELGNDAVIFKEADIYLKTFNLVSKKNIVMNKGLAIKRVLTALLQAEKFSQTHPDKTINYIAVFLAISEPDVKQLRKDIDLSISLNQTLLVTLESQARWAMRNNLIKSKEVPNYLNYIYPNILMSIKEDAVTLY